MADILYSTISKWQGEMKWGNVLDAGTGNSSMDWLLAQNTDSITAITGDVHRQQQMVNRFESRIRAQDRIIADNWLNHELLSGETFDTVIADYLIGAIEGFAPYFQTQFLHRLKPHVKDSLYVIGLEPFSNDDRSEGATIIRKIAALRDACILLAGHQPYREYPKSWVIQQLKLSGYTIEQSADFPIRFGTRYTNGQLDVCKRKLYFMTDKVLIRGLEHQIERLREQANTHIEDCGKINFGYDYIIKSKA